MRWSVLFEKQHKEQTKACAGYLKSGDVINFDVFDRFREEDKKGTKHKVKVMIMFVCYSYRYVQNSN